jgi:NitT/TauT family transport system substrate-binding protein
MRHVWAGSLVVGTVLALLAGTPSDQAAAQMKLVVGIAQAVIFETAAPYYVAQEKGFFKEEGLLVEHVVLRGGGETMQAVASGSVSVAGTGFFGVLGAFQKGARVKVVGTSMTGLYDFYWFSLATSPYRKMEDLAGKQIAYSNPGSSSHMALLAVGEQLKAKGLPAPEAAKVGGMSDGLTALKTRQIDATFAVAPLFLDQVEKGDLRIVFRGVNIERFREVTTRVHVANADFLEKSPEVAKAYFRAHQKALDFMFNNREETVRIWIKGANFKLPPAVVLKTYDFYTKDAMALKPIKGIQTTMEDAINLKFLKQPMTQEELNRLIDLSHLP